MSANDGIWDWDLKTHRVFYSSRWFELVGLCPGATPDHIDTFLNRLHDDDRERVGAEIETYLSGQAQEYKIEFRLRHEDGSWRWILSHGVALRDAHQVAYRIAGTHTDITERVQSAERLERLVAERTADLRASRDRAELAAASTAKFLAATSHDVRQPLQAMALLLGGLERDMKSDSERSTLLAIKRSLLASMELLDGLLEFSRLEAGAMRPSIGAIQIGDLLEATASSFAAEASLRGVRLNVIGSTLTVRSDAQLLGRIVRNLVSNAIKFSQRRRILIGCRRRAGRLHLEVWDTGPGIAEERRREIFWEFVQLAEKPTSGGLGLGLAIVDRLAKLLGHHIHLRSWHGRGSMLSVEMDIAEPRAPATAPPAFDVETGADGYRVALLEDNPEIAAAFHRLFEGWGWRLLQADNLPSLIALLAGAPPDLVIVDWHIVGADNGFEAFDRVEQLFGRRLPGVVLTGDYDFQTIARANVSRRRVLHKPILPQVLHAVLVGELSAAN